MKNVYIGLALLLFAVLFGLPIGREFLSDSFASGQSAIASERFSFSKYGHEKALAQQLRQLIPEGTPKNMVERILVEEGGGINRDSRTQTK